MIVNNAKLERTAVKPDQYPAVGLPEIAFVGRSNVGKSSLINTLLGRRKLARVGATPGRTRVINFYNVEDRLYFVDLPGYGFASVSKAEKAGWRKMIDTYLSFREELRLVVMLVDIRHAPSADDKIMYEWILARGLPHIIAATKADKISRGQHKIRLRDIKAALGAGEGAAALPFSSEDRMGRDELWGHIDNILEQELM